MFFFPNDEFKTIQAKKMLEVIVEKEGLEFLGWREVPTEPDKLSKKARDCMPCIMQCFVKRPEDVERGLEFDRKLYVARRVFEQSNDNTYVVSFSSRTIVYKGMFLVEQLRQFFMDLQDPDYESAIATVHSRFSTNTNPSWERAHPNRFIVHNGEINTIRGNADKMLAREETMESGALKGELHKILPVVDNFERGLDAVKEEEKEDPFVQGMEKVYKHLVTTLEGIEVKPIEAVGQPFDPNFHNAVMHVEDENFGENIVAEEFQKGYTYRDSVVRHSMVKVAN